MTAAERTAYNDAVRDAMEIINNYAQNVAAARMYAYRIRDFIGLLKRFESEEK